MQLITIRQLARRQWLENRKTYLAGTAVLAALTAVAFGITWHWRSSFNGDTRKGLLLLFFFTGGVLFTASFFSPLNNKAKGTWLLSLPVPPAAWLANALLFTLVGYPLVYLGIFYALEGLMYFLAGGADGNFGFTDLLKNGFYTFYFTFVNIQAVILLGSLFFARNALLKTVLLLVAFFFLLTWGNGLWLQQMIGGTPITSSIAFSYFQFEHNGENVYVHLPPAADRTVTLVSSVVLPLALWYLSILRFNEKEI